MSPSLLSQVGRTPSSPLSSIKGAGCFALERFRWCPGGGAASRGGWGICHRAGRGPPAWGRGRTGAGVAVATRGDPARVPAGCREPSPALPTRGHPRPSLRRPAPPRVGFGVRGWIPPHGGQGGSRGVGGRWGGERGAGVKRMGLFLFYFQTFSQPKRPNGSFNRKKSHPMRIGA